MLLKQPVQNVFAQLTKSLSELTDDEYSRPGRSLDASIGQHVRHIIELFQCLDKGYESGVVNYEKRKRDHAIETDRKLAIRLLKEVYERLDKPDTNIVLEAEDYENSGVPVTIATNYYREVAYNLEHTIHHMALIRVGIKEVSTIVLPEEFGIAYSTIKHRQQCAQ